jgi:hypothetical protein
MRRATMFCLALLALSGLGGAVAGSTMALPHVLLLPGEAGSLLLKSVANTFTFRFEGNRIGMSGKGLLLQLHFPNAATNLGTFKLAFSETLETSSNEKCNSLGDAAGEVLVSGEFHLVFDSLTILGDAILLLWPTVEIECPAGNRFAKLAGNSLALVTPINSELLAGSEFLVTTHCGSPLGRPVERMWWNVSGAWVWARLTAQVSGIEEEECLDIAGTVLLQTSRMAELMG